MLITDAVHIWREPDGDYHVEWQASHPDTEVTVEPLAVGALPGQQVAPGRVRLSGLPASTRHYFRVCDQHGTEVVATERRLGMQGTPNFRDFGGYRGADGRRVKWGYLFRSGQLSALTDPDLELLASLQLDLVCDFRRTEEQPQEAGWQREHRLQGRYPRLQEGGEEARKHCHGTGEEEGERRCQGEVVGE